VCAFKSTEWKRTVSALTSDTARRRRLAIVAGGNEIACRGFRRRKRQGVHRASGCQRPFQILSGKEEEPLWMHVRLSRDICGAADGSGRTPVKDARQ
jgi:hypothetical protein